MKIRSVHPTSALFEEAPISEPLLHELEHTAHDGMPHHNHVHPHHCIPFPDQRTRGMRVILDESALIAVLEDRRLSAAIETIVKAPVEIKLLAASMLDIPVAFSDIEATFETKPAGFENPLLADPRIATLSERFGCEQARMRMELASAPAEILALLLVTADSSKSLIVDDETISTDDQCFEETEPPFSE